MEFVVGASVLARDPETRSTITYFIMECPQCVVLTGKAEPRHLTSLVTSCSKSSLPVANRPLLWWTLQVIAAELGGAEILLAVDEPYQKSICDIVASFRSEFSEFKNVVKTVVVPSTERGVIDVLAHLSPYLTTPEIILISDDIFGNLPLRSLYDLHSAKKCPSECTLSMLLFKDELVPTQGKKERKNSSTISGDIVSNDVIICHDESNLLAIRSFADVKQGFDTLKVPFSGLVDRGSSVSVETAFADAHVYLMDRNLLDLVVTLANKYGLDSFRLDVLPFLTAMQTAMSQFNMPNLRVLYLPVGTSGTSDNRVPCRIQSVAQYRSLNSKWCSPRWDELRLLFPFPLTREAHTVKDKGKDALVGINVIIGDKVVLKKSCIDEGCSIGPHTKLTGSVLMKDARVGARVTLTNTILCSGAIVEDECQLVDCIVEANSKVPAGTCEKNETFSREQGYITL